MSGLHDAVNGVVTWRGLLTVMGLVISTAGGVAGWALGQHEQRPHSNAVTQTEYDRDWADIKEDIREIKQLVRSLRDGRSSRQPADPR